MFNFAKLPKTWKKVGSPPKLKIFAFEKETDFCAIQTLRIYLNRSQEWIDEKKTQLLLAINKSHKPVSVSTVSRWIKDIMSLSEMDVSWFKGHPTRSIYFGKADGLVSPLGKNSIKNL